MRPRPPACTEGRFSACRRRRAGQRSGRRPLPPSRQLPSRARHSVATGGSAASSTRSTRAPSPIRTADGIGDLPGLIDRLDYLNDGTERSLGIDAIWLSPIHPSPGFDVGYDVSDYDDIDPMLGTLADFDRLIAEAHRRGIRVMLDLVMNHTSSAHRWFEESRRDPNGPYGDFYLWRDGRPARVGGRLRKPNNWASFFGGSAWTVGRGARSSSTCTRSSPSSRTSTGATRRSGPRCSRWFVGWLDRGVDGFRLDVFNAFFKHVDLLSNPRNYRGRRPYDRQRHVYDKDRPELKDFLTEFRALVDSYPGADDGGGAVRRRPCPRPRIDPASAPGVRLRAAAPALVSGRRTPPRPRSRRTCSAASIGRRVVLGNHDNARLASRLAPHADAESSDQLARAAAVLALTLRGTPFLYYGDEIGGA